MSIPTLMKFIFYYEGADNKYQITYVACWQVVSPNGEKNSGVG